MFLLMMPCSIFCLRNKQRNVKYWFCRTVLCIFRTTHQTFQAANSSPFYLLILFILQTAPKLIIYDLCNTAVYAQINSFNVTYSHFFSN